MKSGWAKPAKKVKGGKMPKKPKGGKIAKKAATPEPQFTAPSKPTAREAIEDLLNGKIRRATRERPDWVQRHLGRLRENTNVQQRLISGLVSMDEDVVCFLYWLLEDRTTADKFLDTLTLVIDSKTRKNAPDVSAH